MHAYHTIYSNHSTVHQSSRSKSTCVHPCMRLTQWKKLQSTGVGLASGVAAAHNSWHNIIAVTPEGSEVLPSKDH